MLLLVVLDALIVGVPHLEEATKLLSLAPKTNEAPAKQQQAQQQNFAGSCKSWAAWDSTPANDAECQERGKSGQLSEGDGVCHCVDGAQGTDSQGQWVSEQQEAPKKRESSDKGADKKKEEASKELDAPNFDDGSWHPPEQEKGEEKAPEGESPKEWEAPKEESPKAGQEQANSWQAQRGDTGPYFELMGQLFSRNNGSQLAQCLKQQQHKGWETRDSTFLTVGIEGSGHHLISLLKASDFPAHEGNTSNWQPCKPHDELGLGCMFSFPCGRWAHKGVPRPDTWPEPDLWTKESGACPTLAELAKLGKVPADSNYFVMLRDPISSFTSSLARFWDGCGDTSFDRLRLADEMAAHEQSAAEMDKFVRGLPCDRTLVMSYEMLMQFPEMHRASLAAFLNVQPEGWTIEGFFSQFDHFLSSQLSKSKHEEVLRRSKPQVLRSKDASSAAPTLPLTPLSCEHQCEVLFTLGAKVNQCVETDNGGNMLPKWLQGCASDAECAKQWDEGIRASWKRTDWLARFPNVMSPVPIEQHCECDFSETQQAVEWAPDGKRIEQDSSSSSPDPATHAPATHAPATHAPPGWWAPVLASGPFKPPFEDVQRHVCDTGVQLTQTLSPGMSEMANLSKWLFGCEAAEYEDTPATCSKRESCWNDCEDTPCARLADYFDGRVPECSWVTRESCDYFARLHEFDGIGHVYNALSFIQNDENKRGRYRPYDRFFEEHFDRNGVHLKLPNLPHGASLYCHQIQFADLSSFASPKEVWDKQYQCFKIPPLDDWFNVASKLPVREGKKGHECIELQVDSSVAGKARSAASLSRERYWQVDRNLTCGRPEGAVQIAMHLRLGDLVPEMVGEGDEDAQKRYKVHFSDRLVESLTNFKTAFDMIARVAAAFKTRKSALHILVVTDSPVSTVKKVAEPYGLKVQPGRSYNDGVAEHTLAKVSSAEQGADVEIDFLGDSNPLVGAHCLSAADVLVAPTGNFGLMTEALSRGRVLDSNEALRAWAEQITQAQDDGAQFAGLLDELSSAEGDPDQVYTSVEGQPGVNADGWATAAPECPQQ